MAAAQRILVTGAGGRLGRLLRAHWPRCLPGGVAPLWQGRRAVAPGWLSWDMLDGPYPGPRLDGGVILHLAGVTGGDASALADNGRLALAALAAAEASGAARVFVASTAAVYGPGGGADLAEDGPTAPANAYGAAKLRMERQVIEAASACRAAVTILRIGNVLGCDALIGGAQPGRTVILDPVPEREGGPERSYIGPQTLAEVLAQLCVRALQGGHLPDVVNVAADPPVRMADLLEAAGLDWRYGPENPAVIARVALSCDRLRGLVTLPKDAGDPHRMVAEWRGGHEDAP